MAAAKKPIPPKTLAKARESGKQKIKFDAVMARTPAKKTIMKQAIEAVKPKVAKIVERAAKPKPKVKIPAKLGAAADLYYTTRESRLVLDREAAGLKAEEGVIREHLIEKLPKGDATGVAGKLCRVTIKAEVIPVADDWSKIYAHIVAEYARHLKAKDGQQDAAFALLNKALNAAAVKDVWEAKKAVPGVGKFNSKSVSINKL